MTPNVAAFIGYLRNNRFSIALILFWSVGLLTGFAFFLAYMPSEFLLMRGAVFQPVSIVGVFCTTFLPLFFTYVSVLINRPMLVLVVSFIKAASFGFTISLISALYGSAAWLLCLLSMMSDSCFLIVLFILWIQNPFSCKTKRKRIFTISSIFALLISLGDYFIFSPLLTGLF